MEYLLISIKKSSLFTYDVNLYSAHMGYPTFIFDMGNKIKLQPIGGQFKAQNRLAQILLFNNAFHAFNEVNHSNLGWGAGYSIANLVKATGTCGTVLFDNNRVNVNQLRSDNVNTRNTAMSKQLLAFGNKWPDLSSYCSLIAANYEAPEGYVSYGAVWDMITLQPVLDMSTLNNIEKNAVLNLDDYELWDAVLMNFSYGIEHTYEGGNYDSSKFGKYMARTRRLALMVKDKDCFKTAFQPLDQAYPYDKDNITNAARDKALKAVGDLRKSYAKASDAVAKTFIEAGVKCVREIIDQDEKSHHRRRRNKNRRLKKKIIK